MKVTVRVRQVLKKVCYVSHVIVHKINPSLYFIEIDFCGTNRPVYIGHGDDVIMFAPQTTGHDAGSDDIQDGSISVEFKLPRGFKRTDLYGHVMKRTWRGYLSNSRFLRPAYEQKKVVWNSFRDKPRRQL